MRGWWCGARLMADGVVTTARTREARAGRQHAAAGGRSQWSDGSAQWRGQRASAASWVRTVERIRMCGTGSVDSTRSGDRLVRLSNAFPVRAPQRARQSHGQRVTMRKGWYSYATGVSLFVSRCHACVIE